MSEVERVEESVVLSVNKRWLLTGHQSDLDGQSEIMVIVFKNLSCVVHSRAEVGAISAIYFTGVGVVRKSDDTSIEVLVPLGRGKPLVEKERFLRQDGGSIGVTGA
jgi:hypothetical protein